MDYSINNPPQQDQFGTAKRIDLRPRANWNKPDSDATLPAIRQEPLADDVILTFSCPACLHMIGQSKAQASTSSKCPACEAWVMPPQVVTMSGGKTSLPAARKPGIQPTRGI
jgi:hypothetical protein